METEFSKNMIYGNYLSMENDAFPIDCETLAALQNNIQKLAVIACIAGADCLILKGCKEKGSYRTEGYVYVSEGTTGEILYHPEQLKNDYCHTAETSETITADNVEYKDAYSIRYLSEGLGNNPLKWSDFVDISNISNAAVTNALTEYKQTNDKTLKSLQKTIADTITEKEKKLNKIIEEKTTSSNVAFVEGMIMMWSGYSDSIPSGWALCDGNNGTPDLRGRFVVGAWSNGYYNDIPIPTGNSIPNELNQYVFKNTGGKERVTLDKNNLPSHNHSVKIESAGEHRHYIDNQGYRKCQKGDYRECVSRDSVLGDPTDQNRFLTKNAGSHTHTITESNVGEGKSFSILPPYYALCFIMKL